MKPVRAAKRRNSWMSLGLLVTVGALVAVFLYSAWTNYVLSHEIEQLKLKAQHLRFGADQQKYFFGEFKNSTDGTITTLDSSLKKLNGDHASFEMKATRKLTNISEYIVVVEKELTETKLGMQQTQTKVDAVESYAQNTYKGLNTLGEQSQDLIKQHPTINLADHCSTESVQCTAPSSKQGSYWKSCQTSKVTLNLPVRATVHVHAI